MKTLGSRLTVAGLLACLLLLFSPAARANPVNSAASHTRNFFSRIAHGGEDAVVAGAHGAKFIGVEAVHGASWVGSRVASGVGRVI